MVSNHIIFYMIKLIRAYYRNQSFYPGALALIINPFFLARANLAVAMKSLAPSLTGRLLDIGCGTKPYKPLFDVDEYIGLDIDSDISRNRGVADYYYDGTTFPFNVRYFDSALCNQVLEHVFNPDEFLQEINRVLKPGGKLLLTVPFVWDEHEQPYDYARYTSFGLKALLEKNGFVVLRHIKLGDNASTLFQLANAYCFKVTHSWPKFIRRTLMLTVMAPLNILGLIAGKILPDNPDLFLDHVVLAEKVS